MKLPNGYGSVVKMSGKRRNPWRVYAPAKYELEDDKAKAKRKTIGYCKTKQEALKLLADYHKNPIQFTSGVTFSNVFYMWKEANKYSVSEDTIKYYTSIFNACSNIKDKLITKITTEELQEIINTKNSYNTKCFTRSFLTNMFNFAYKKYLIDILPTRYLIVGEKNKVIKRNVFTKEEIKILWNNKNDFVSQCLLVLIYTGMRANELLYMEHSNVFIEDRYMIGGSKTESGKDRCIPICNKILPLIKSFYNNSSEYLLDYNRTKQNFFKSIKKYFINLNMQHTSHDCRHTFISALSELDVPLVKIKKIVGHSTGNITQDVYTHKKPEELIEVVDKLDDYFCD